MDIKNITIGSDTTAGSVVADINSNFGKVNVEMEKYKTNLYNKGSYKDAAALTAAIPSPKVGDFANVGGLKYECQTAGTWTNTNIAITISTTDIASSFGTSDTKAVSQNLFSETITALEQEQIQGGVYDVSAHNNGAVFESLSVLLGSANLSTLIPTSVRHGGMSIRFIQGSGSNNKYVQYRLMTSSFSTTELDWQGVDEEPTVGSDNLVKSGGVMEGNIAVETLIDGKQLLSAHLDGHNRLPIQTLKAGKVYILTNESDIPIYTSGYAFFNSDGISVSKNRIDGSQGASDNILKGGWETFYVNDDVEDINIRFYGSNGIFSIKEKDDKIKVLQQITVDLKEEIDENAFDITQKAELTGSAWTELSYTMYADLTYNVKLVTEGSILGFQAKDSDGNAVTVTGYTNLTEVGSSCNVQVAKDAVTLRIYFDRGCHIIIKNNLLEYVLNEDSALKAKDTELENSVKELDNAIFQRQEYSGAGWAAYTAYSFVAGYPYKITNVSTNANSKIIAFGIRRNTTGVTFRTLEGDLSNLTPGNYAIIVPNGDANECRAYFDGGAGTITIENSLEIVPEVYKLKDAVEIQESYSSKDYIKHQVIVSKTGEEGNFSTIADAYASITDSSYTNQYEVIVYPGKYNEVNLQVPPFTHTHGVFPNSVVISSEGYNTTQPVIEQAYSSSKLSNLTIESHTGYCIHYDQSLSHQVIVNTNLFLNKVATGQGATTWSIIGGGTFYFGTKFIWKNCTFRCTELGRGNAACHTNGNQVNGNTILIFDGCIFINCAPSIGSVGGSGNYICELTNCSFPVGAIGLMNWFSPIRNVEDPTLYRFEKNEWNVIGGGNKNLSMWQLISGKTIRLVADYPITISGSAASIIFGYNPTINNVKTARLNCTLTSEYYIADEQAGYPPYSEVIDVFQLWKRLGDCSTTNKTLTITVNNVSKTYTFTENYLSTKTTQAIIIAAMQAVLDNVTIEAITQSGYGYFNVNTSDCMMVKVMSDDILKGEFVTNDGHKATSETAIKDIVGVACEDKPINEFIKVWTSAFRFDTDYADGEYGLDANGALDANAANKIGFVKGYNFYLYK